MGIERGYASGARSVREKSDVQTIDVGIGAEERIVFGDVLQLACRAHDHGNSKTESVGKRRGNERRDPGGEGERRAKYDVAALDVGADGRASRGLEDGSEVLHRQGIPSAHVDATQQGDVDGALR